MPKNIKIFDANANHDDNVKSLLQTHLNGGSHSTFNIESFAFMSDEKITHFIYEEETIKVTRIITTQDNDEPTTFEHKGTTYHFLGGKLHCENGPAQFNEQGEEYWRINVILHREDGTAFRNNHSTLWYWHSKMHRENVPAIEITKNGRKVWFINGEFQRAIDKDNNELNQYMQKVVSE